MARVEGVFDGVRHSQLLAYKDYARVLGHSRRLLVTYMPLAPFLHAALFLRPDRAYRSKTSRWVTFASVPEDCLDKASDWFAKEDFLCQRAVSPLARDAARRGIMRKVPRKSSRSTHAAGLRARICELFALTRHRSVRYHAAGDDGPAPRCGGNGKGVWARLH